MFENFIRKIVIKNEARVKEAKELLEMADCVLENYNKATDKALKDKYLKDWVELTNKASVLFGFKNYYEMQKYQDKKWEEIGNKYSEMWRKSLS